MSSPIKGTWHDDPAHFRRPSRRSFLHVGVIGGLGLTLGDFLRLEAQAKAAGEVKEGKAAKERPKSGIAEKERKESRNSRKKLSKGPRKVAK